MLFEIKFKIGFTKPSYHTGKLADHKMGIKIRNVKREKRIDWTCFKRKYANLFVVTYVGTNIGEFWSWES